MRHKKCVLYKSKISLTIVFFPRFLKEAVDEYKVKQLW
jgi:hypothetical protein